ncbi:sensor histidine kinase [Ferrimonas marina]|uniref:histidine kinase n=1 Tax=Ferrimonas marina TaxID=299255 RepID=A0A1M5X292_9GAMM|nr:ATP-binding protein [Ferrimonas marina]SHH93939.1 His Kinase A (phospho-acceptor) domain-containing protein [Ferrimonas marina]
MSSLLIFNIYLFYGLAFFAIGSVIAFQNLRFSQLPIATALPALALFGFTHAFHEWAELYLELLAPYKSLSWLREMAVLRTIKLWLSFVALTWFAWLMLGLIRFPLRHWVRTGTYGLFLLFGLHVLFSAFYLNQDHYLDTVNLLTRLIFGLGASVVAGAALILYARQHRAESDLSAVYFGYCGIALIAYGLAAGLLKTEWSLWVPVTRTFCALAVLVTLFRALKIFDRERELQIQAQQRQLYRGEKMRAMGELASGIAHEIKTPLSYAQLSCDLLQKRWCPDAPERKQLDRVQRGLQRAAHISQEVLQFSRQQPAQMQTVQLSEVVHSALDLMAHRLKPFTVACRLDPSLRIQGDRIKLEEVLINLLQNAIDASEQEKSLEIHSWARGDRVLLQVLDHGSGIDPTQLKRVLQPFYTTKDNGTGLGLAISQQIIHEHQGELTLDNWMKGLRVTINLPRYLA